MLGRSELLARPLSRFPHLGDEELAELFVHAPAPVRGPGAPDVASALGAVLYGPATSPTFGERLLGRHWEGVTAAVLCLEDAIGDRELEAGEARLEALLVAAAREREAGRPRSTMPFLFTRVRGPEHLEALLERFGGLADELDGFVLPKVTVTGVTRALGVARSVTRARGRALWAMPILEGPDIAHKELRLETLLGLREVLRDHADLVPSVRIGATDLSGHWALRRTRDFTVYDVAVVRDVIADSVNVLGGAEGVRALSGPVWEYVRDPALFKPPLRETPFRDELGMDGLALRRRLVSSAVDGLLRETLLDRVNGLYGKTVIHPSHALAVDAAHTVTYDEYVDACNIRDANLAGNGIRAQDSGARMNEPKPHARWADRTLARADAFGVLHPDRSFLAILAEGRHGA